MEIQRWIVEQLVTCYLGISVHYGSTEPEKLQVLPCGLSSKVTGPILVLIDAADGPD